VIGDLLLASTGRDDGFRRSGEFPRFLGELRGSAVLLDPIINIRLV
jgi:hypothetical protein